MTVLAIAGLWQTGTIRRVGRAATNMQRYDGLAGLRQLPAGTALTIGNFDGLHRGHRRIIELARELAGPAGVAVVTFEPHPLTVLRPERVPPQLTPLGLKVEMLAELGVDHLVTLPPTAETLDLTAEAFWQLLRDDVRPDHLIEGPVFNFGKNRGGTIDRLREWSAKSDVALHVVPSVEIALLDLKVVRISSSLIRWLLLTGRAREAAICLGSPFVLRGTVVTGFQRGRTIGVPTANLELGEQMVPAEGVYVGRCAVAGVTYAAAVSIGTLPTFGDERLQIEVHLIGFSGDLYGQTLDVELLDWIREQWKFPGIDALKQRLATDIAWASARSTFDATRPIASLT